jgi:drug/metabolite transporter (DMT)-like permease
MTASNSIAVLTRTQKVAVYSALAAGILIIGFSPVLLRWAGAPGLVSSFYRMLIASLVMFFPFATRLQKGKSRLTRNGVRFAILGGFFFAMDLSLWSTGVMLSGATIPTLMSNAAPVFVGIGAWLFYKERQSKRFWIGMLISMLGTILVLREDLGFSGDVGMGSLLGLLSGFFYGSYYLVTQGGRAILDTISYFWIAVATSTLVLLLANILFKQSFGGYSWQVLLSFLVMGLIVQIAGWLIINYAQGYLPASIVAPTLLLQPVVTALFAQPLLGERLTLWHILGGGAVLAGIFMVHLSRLNPSHPE